MREASALKSLKQIFHLDNLRCLGNVADGGNRNPYLNRKGGYGHSPPAGCARPGSTRREWLYEVLGLFNGYRVRRFETKPKFAPAR